MRRQADQPPVLGREQDPAVAEAGEERGLDGPDDRAAVVVRLRAPRHGHGMGVGQQQPETHRTLGEPPEVAAPVEQVVDELPSCGLLLADRQPLRPLVSLGEGVDGLLHGAQEVPDGGVRHVGEDPLRGRQVGADEGPQADADLRGPLPLGAQGLALVTGEPAAPAHTPVRISA